MAKIFRLSVWQDDIEVAAVSGHDFECVYREAMHYQFVYSQDGPTEMKGIPRDKIDWIKNHLSRPSKSIAP